MSPFRAPVDDILFSLEHVAGASELAGYDGDLHREIASHFAAFAEDVLAPLNAVGDRFGARLEDGRVRMPDGFGAAYRQYCEQGWPGLVAPEELGGQGLGDTAFAVLSEIFTGANHALEMICGLVPGAIRTLTAFGTPGQQAACIPALVSGQWLATMALTEPGAGSDLSRITCRAVRQGDGWSVTGEKIFISGGDQDLSEGILHLVLARTAEGGLSGLSLFLCRSVLETGERNSVSVARVEEKLGIHASPTCQLVFDGAEAELIGSEGQGLAAMFAMMNHMRVAVALEGVAHAARATDIARHYAAERVQGKGSVIAAHPDVARMLDEMDLRAVGARGIAHLAVVTLQRGDAPELVEVLTPLAKFFCSEVASEAADLGIQVLGGYGFLEEYGMAQVLRDTRVCRIYEGANGIHALSLATRLVRLDRPLQALDAVLSGVPELAEEQAIWRNAWTDMRTVSDARPLADAFMRLTAEIVHQMVWFRISQTASLHREPGRLIRLSQRARCRFGVASEHYNAQMEINSNT